MTATHLAAGDGVPAGLRGGAEQLPVNLLLAVRAAQQHARDLAAVLAGGADHLRARAHVSADALAHVRHLAPDPYARLDPVARHARDLDRDLAYARDLALALAGAVPAAAPLAARLDLDLALARALGGDPEQARELVRRLDRDRDGARRLAHDLRAVPHSPPGPLCRHLVSCAVRVLPGEHQARYAHEYAAELWELGVQRGARRRRLGYALRLGVSCWSLRRALSGAPAEGRES
jgi:hypothetical protein